MKTFYFMPDNTADKVINDLNGRQRLEIANKARIHNTSLSKILNKKVKMSLITFERLLAAGYLNLDNYPELAELPQPVVNNLKRIDAMNKLIKGA